MAEGILHFEVVWRSRLWTQLKLLHIHMGFFSVCGNHRHKLQTKCLEGYFGFESDQWGFFCSDSISLGNWLFLFRSTLYCSIADISTLQTFTKLAIHCVKSMNRVKNLFIPTMDGNIWCDFEFSQDFS